MDNKLGYWLNNSFFPTHLNFFYKIATSPDASEWRKKVLIFSHSVFKAPELMSKKVKSFYDLVCKDFLDNKHLWENDVMVVFHLKIFLGYGSHSIFRTWVDELPYPVGMNPILKAYNDRTELTDEVIETEKDPIVKSLGYYLKGMFAVEKKERFEYATKALETNRSNLCAFFMLERSKISILKRLTHLENIWQKEKEIFSNKSINYFLAELELKYETKMSYDEYVEYKKIWEAREKEVSKPSDYKKFYNMILKYEKKKKELIAMLPFIFFALSKRLPREIIKTIIIPRLFKCIVI